MKYFRNAVPKRKKDPRKKRGSDTVRFQNDSEIILLFLAENPEERGDLLFVLFFGLIVVRALSALTVASAFAAVVTVTCAVTGCRIVTAVVAVTCAAVCAVGTAIIARAARVATVLVTVTAVILRLFASRGSVRLLASSACVVRLFSS